MNKKNKPKLKKIIAVILLIIMATSVIGAIAMTNLHKEPQIIENSIITNTEITNTTEEIAIEKTITEQTPEKEETYTTMYSTTGLNIRFEPNTDSKIFNTVAINTELMTVDDSEENGWIKIKLDDDYYYVARRYVSTEKTKIQTTSRGETTSKTYKQSSGSGVLTKSKGVNYFNGHKETWYSQRVLPGGGLKIPGRHVNSQGLVCDKDGYICVASSDYSKGIIVETSLGTGKVYDSGCASGTIDIYTDW